MQSAWKEDKAAVLELDSSTRIPGDPELTQ
jgi:hypothetical protein